MAVITNANRRGALVGLVGAVAAGAGFFTAPPDMARWGFVLLFAIGVILVAYHLSGPLFPTYPTDRSRSTEEGPSCE